MKTITSSIAIAAALAAMSGCSSFKLGAACYIPRGVTGQCSATTVAPAVVPAGTASQPVKPSTTGV